MNRAPDTSVALAPAGSGRPAAPGSAGPVPRSRRVLEAVLVGATTTLVALAVAARHVGTGTPPGADATGHLQRIEHAWTLFRAGRVDGWFPGAMLGYQAHLIYGPGLGVATGLVRLATFGLVDAGGALRIVLVLAFVAVPFAVAALGRALGLDRWTAAAAGALALAVSSPRGGGLEGAFTTALAAQQVAVPLVVAALALGVECVRRAERRPVAALAITATVLALTHPISFTLLGLLGPLVLAAAWGTGVIEPRRLRRLAAPGLWFAGLAACWWLPVVLHRDLRGPATSWDQPAVIDHVRMLATGERGWRGIAGPIAAVAVVAAALAGWARRRRALVALALLPVGALAALHAVHATPGLDAGLAMQFPNRGLAYAALLAAPVTARVLAAMVPARLAGGRGPVAWVAALAIVAASVGGLEPTPTAAQAPIPDLVDAAAVLRAEVPDGARFAYVAGPYHLGVPAPERWLAWASGRPGLSPFGPEYAPGAGVAMDAGRPPAAGRLDAWVGRLRVLAVSHVVVADLDVVARLRATTLVEPVLATATVEVMALVDGPGAPVGSVVPAHSARVRSAGPDEHVVEVDGATDRVDVALALGWSPGWTARIDGEPVPTRRAPDGRLAIDVPRGRHVVHLRFEEPGSGPVGRAVTMATVIGLIVARRRQRTDGNPRAAGGLGEV